MKKLLALGLILAGLLALAPNAHAVSSPTSCYAMEKPSTGDQVNTWGVTENTARDIVDQALAGSVSTTGGATALADSQFAVSQAKNAVFTITGALTSNATILWPNGRCRAFSVTNNTTGAFSTTLCVNNGSSACAGAAVVIPQGQTMELYADGTNITGRFNASAGAFTANGAITATGVITATGSVTASGGSFIATGNSPAGGTQTWFGQDVSGNTSVNIPTGKTFVIFANNSSSGFSVSTGGAVNASSAVLGSPTGGNEGAGTLNATGIFVNGAPVGAAPTGSVMAFAGSSAPTGWLIADGSAVSRTTFAALFAVVGTAYGAGDGSTTFNLPDLRARSVAGFDSGNATGRLTANTAQGVSASALGNTGGEQAHSQTAAEMATHSHGITDPGHTHGIPGLQQGGAGANVFILNGTGGNVENTISATTGISVNNAGSGNAANVMGPTIILNYIIKT